jgi:hypothetical protein
MGATFNSVFSPDSLQIPWYITGGTPDWQGNISGARAARSARARPRGAAGCRLGRAVSRRRRRGAGARGR